MHFLCCVVRIARRPNDSKSRVVWTRHNRSVLLMRSIVVLKVQLYCKVPLIFYAMTEICYHSTRQLVWSCDIFLEVDTFFTPLGQMIFCCISWQRSEVTQMLGAFWRPKRLCVMYGRLQLSYFTDRSSVCVCCICNIFYISRGRIRIHCQSKNTCGNWGHFTGHFDYVCFDLISVKMSICITVIK